MNSSPSERQARVCCSVERCVGEARRSRRAGRESVSPAACWGCVGGRVKRPGSASASSPAGRGARSGSMSIFWRLDVVEEAEGESRARFVPPIVVVRAQGARRARKSTGA